MELEREELEFLASEYESKIETVMKYYEILKEVPCVINHERELFLECLETLIQERKSEKMLGETKSQTSEKYQTLEFSVSDSLFRVYGDDAVPYLSEEYRIVNSARFELPTNSNYDAEEIIKLQHRINRDAKFF